MVYDEPCNFSQGGPMMPTPAQKNEAMTLCVGSDMRAIPFLNVLEMTR